MCQYFCFPFYFNLKTLNKMRRLVFLLGFVLISCVLPVQAADVSGDALSNNAPDVFSRASMRVQADYAEFDSQKDEAIYSGNVEITRDDLVIFGDQAIVNNSVDQSGNRKIKITGSPVRLKLKDTSKSRSFISL